MLVIKIIHHYEMMVDHETDLDHEMMVDHEMVDHEMVMMVDDDCERWLRKYHF